MRKQVKADAKQQLYIIDEGDCITCLGFDVCNERAVKISREMASLNVEVPAPAPIGSIERYNQLQSFYDQAKHLYDTTGYRFKCELVPQLIGLEGKRVEVVTKFGETKRFWVGKSTGWVPCHLEIMRSNSRDGLLIYDGFKSVRVIATGRR